ncbi:cyclic nucleotide-gated channel rod photoreceptor subunit alpha [Caerostris extrusa]|uniref:Cyclic nucleotide-gated channel rod photoreceptor subunit alpha n=1 Tax=Caerostris extrusa TaxID=172846 RepID=A0AAV4N2P4_CAEEX|nr:cyclic nucleotide-gated channel rod photoreceptor subunit alpha [Caerostris extrusa]
MCKWTFVFDPSGRLCYYWSVVVSVAFLYNFWVIIYRFAFQEITVETLYAWFTLDYMADFIYILDIAVHFRTGFLEEGVSIPYFEASGSSRSTGSGPSWTEQNATQTIPMSSGALSLTHYVLVIFHWNACLFHIISKNGGFGSQDWFPKAEGEQRCTDQYLHGFYWSTLTLAHIGGLPHPRTRGEYFFSTGATSVWIVPFCHRTGPCGEYSD